MPRKHTLWNFNHSKLDPEQWKEEAPLVIAHRGASHYAPENTMAAFEKARSTDADAIELDVQLSADGEVMVFHDLTLDRTTSGSGALRDFSAKELRRLDAGSHFDAAFAEEKIPFLSDVITQFARSMLINIELKNFSRPWNDLPDRVLDIVREYQAEDRVLLSSFNPWALIRANKRSPDIPVGLLVAGSQQRWIRVPLQRVLRYDAFHPHHELLSPQIVLSHHQHARIVNAWTLDDPERMLKLCAWGVDGLITNEPGLARATLKKAGYYSSR